MFVPAAGSFAQVLEEIVVTAQKREQSIQNVGISVTAFSGEQIRKLGFNGSDDIAQQTPGVLFTQAGGSESIGLPAIRGVAQNDFGPHQELPVAVYVDESYLSFNGAVLFSMMDLERVEVLRGPQGTLFGRNATGGLIHYITRKPTEAFEAYTDITVGSYGQVKFEGAVSGPLGERVLGRVSVATNRHDGYIDNRMGGELMDNEVFGARAQVLFRISDRAEALVGLTAGAYDVDQLGPYQHRGGGIDADGLGFNLPYDMNFNGSCPGCDFFGYLDADQEAHAGDIGTPGFLERDIWGITARITWNLDRSTLTSVSHYVDFEYDYLEDSDVSPVSFGEFRFGQRADQFSQELRLNGEADRTRWVAGFYYLNIDSDNYSGFLLPAPITGVSLDTAWALETTSWAVFGQVEYDLAPQWALIGGLRWTDDEKEMDLLNTVTLEGIGTFPNLVFNRDTAGGLAELSDADHAAKLELDWRPNDDWLLYASVTRGNKGGSFSAPLDVIPLAAVPYDPEVLTSYEVGFKSTLFNGSARLNASVFHYDYSDFQAFRIENLAQIVFNADAEADGGEIEWMAHLEGGWDFVLGAAFLDAEVFDVTLPSGRVTDREPPQAPGFSFNGLVRKQWPAFGGTLAIQADFHHVDDYQASQFNSPATAIPDYSMTNVRLSYESGDGSWDAALFVRNIADHDIQTYAFDLANAHLGFNQLVFLPPRWVGAQFRYHWR